jgi:hypothetical protein
VDSKADITPRKEARQKALQARMVHALLLL